VKEQDQGLNLEALDALRKSLNSFDDHQLNTLGWSLNTLYWEIDRILEQRVDARIAEQKKLEKEYGNRKTT
jgi:hypothetical protein